MGIEGRCQYTGFFMHNFLTWPRYHWIGVLCSVLEADVANKHSKKLKSFPEKSPKPLLICSEHICKILKLAPDCISIRDKCSYWAKSLVIV